MAEQELIVPVELPGAEEALVYVLASEVNFNDIWAITGIPVSSFDNHDQDVQVTGSGGRRHWSPHWAATPRREGRLKVGDLVAMYSGQTDLLSPLAGARPDVRRLLDPGLRDRTGSHAQFLVTQAPQLHPCRPT